MKKPLPTLAALAVIVAACSAGGTDTMAELMHDAGAMLAEAGQKLMDAAAGVDAAGPSDARAAIGDIDARSGGEAAAAADDGASRTSEAAGPVRTPPRALEANCTTNAVSTVTATGTSTTYHFAQFDVADPNTVLNMLVCDPVSSPFANYCPNNANQTCTGFTIPTPECATNAWGFQSSGKYYVFCGQSSSPGGADTHFRKARLIVM